VEGQKLAEKARGARDPLKTLSSLLATAKSAGFNMVSANVLRHAAARRSRTGASPLLDAVKSPSSVPNFRDLGQIPGIRKGVVLRSACPGNISEEDAEALSSIETVLDLRSEHDATKGSNVGPRRLASKTKHLPLLGEKKVKKGLLIRARTQPLLLSLVVSLKVLKKLSPSRRLKKKLSIAADKKLAKLFNTISLADTYEFIVNQNGDELVQAFDLIASSDARPLLVHCTHGKDRTGVLIALLLYACGVPEEDIVEDYMRSHDYGCSVEGKAAMASAFPDKLMPYLREGLIDEWCEAPAEALRELFRRMEQNFGSMTKYFDSIGIDEAYRQRLASQLRVPQEELEDLEEEAEGQRLTRRTPCRTP